MATLQHVSLNGTFLGLEEDGLIHYRGIPYGVVDKRFTDPKANDDFGKVQVDCTRFGPRCPQPEKDMGYLSRESEGNVFHDETEDEFKCLNLDITIPASHKQKHPLPVFLWIHGGSQIVSYGNSASKLGDVRKLVQQSDQLQTPMMVVSVQYRLGIFAVGDNSERINFALKDLRCAVDWACRHIGGFGGDSNNISLIGESGGAALVHALIVAGVEVKRAALMSGSMYMSGPRTHAMTKAALIDPIANKLLEKGTTIEEAAAADLVNAERAIENVWFQETPELQGWPGSTGKIEELMIGTCEFETAIFRKGVEGMTMEMIDQAFSNAGLHAEELKRLYHINKTRPQECRLGTLDFLNDILWESAVTKLKTLYEQSGKRVWSYAFDQANPWQMSARAHHAVDLLYLFEGFDISMNPSAARLARDMREKFIAFANGKPPWSSEHVFAFGPFGKVGEVSEEEMRARRRMAQMAALSKIRMELLWAVVIPLARGNVSLEN